MIQPKWQRKDWLLNIFSQPASFKNLATASLLKASKDCLLKVKIAY